MAINLSDQGLRQGYDVYRYAAGGTAWAKVGQIPPWVEFLGLRPAEGPTATSGKLYFNVNGTVTDGTAISLGSDNYATINDGEQWLLDLRGNVVQSAIENVWIAASAEGVDVQLELMTAHTAIGRVIQALNSDPFTRRGQACR